MLPSPHSSFSIHHYPLSLSRGVLRPTIFNRYSEGNGKWDIKNFPFRSARNRNCDTWGMTDFHHSQFPIPDPPFQLRDPAILYCASPAEFRRMEFLINPFPHENPSTISHYPIPVYIELRLDLRIVLTTYKVFNQIKAALLHLPPLLQNSPSSRYGK